MSEKSVLTMFGWQQKAYTSLLLKANKHAYGLALKNNNLGLDIIGGWCLVVLSLAVDVPLNEDIYDTKN